MAFDYDDWKKRFDALSARHNFRQLAIDWHDGQWSAFYKFQCSGVVDPSHAGEIASECRSNLRLTGDNVDANRAQDYDSMLAFEAICDEYSDAHCSECGEELDTNCNGDLHCPDCDGPCPCCSDGAGYPYSFGIDEDYPD